MPGSPFREEHCASTATALTASVTSSRLLSLSPSTGKHAAKVHHLSRYGFAAGPYEQLTKVLPDTPLSFARWLRRWASRDGPREELAAACRATPRPPRHRPRRTALSIAPSRRRAVAFAKEWPVVGCLPAADPATATALPNRRSRDGTALARTATPRPRGRGGPTASQATHRAS